MHHAVEFIPQELAENQETIYFRTPRCAAGTCSHHHHDSKDDDAHRTPIVEIRFGDSRRGEYGDRLENRIDRIIRPIRAEPVEEDIEGENYLSG